MQQKLQEEAHNHEVDGLDCIFDVQEGALRLSSVDQLEGLSSQKCLQHRRVTS